MSPSPRCLDHADDSLTTAMDMHMLNNDLLLTFSSVPIEGVQQHRKCSRELIGLAQRLTAALETLLRKHGAAITFHHRAVCCDQLCGHHPFQLVFRGNPGKTRISGDKLPMEHVRIGVLDPERRRRVVYDLLVPGVELRSAEP